MSSCEKENKLLDFCFDCSFEEDGHILAIEEACILWMITDTTANVLRYFHFYTLCMLRSLSICVKSTYWKENGWQETISSIPSGRLINMIHYLKGDILTCLER